MEKNGIEFIPHHTTYKGEASVIAEKISSESGNADIIIIGGDGTINEVINGLRDFSKIRLSVIPAGSGNDFARELKIKKHAPIKTLRKILSNIENNSSQKIDLGRTTFTDESGEAKSKLFAISSGFGLDAEVCRKVDISKLKTFLNRIHAGKLSYTIETVISLFSMKTFSLSAEFDDGEKKDFTKAIFFSSMNFKCQGGGVKFAPGAIADDGKLSLCAVSEVAKIRTFFLLPFIVKGWHKIFKCFYFKNFKRVQAVCNTEAVLHTDGEVFTGVKEFSVELAEEKLCII